MTTRNFNVKNGLTAGNITLDATTNTTTTSNLVATGNVNLTGPNVSLGAVANLHISGGSSGYVLTTDGSSNLSWVTPSSTQSPAPMPIVIDSGNTLTISANYQGLFGTPLTINGTLVVDGALIDVSGQGAAGTDSQVTFNDNGDPAGSNGFTFNKTTGNLSVPGSINGGAFLKLTTYNKTALTAITGAIGQIASVTDSTPAGLLAFWDGTNNRWSYVHDNSAV